MMSAAQVSGSLHKRLSVPIAAQSGAGELVLNGGLPIQRVRIEACGSSQRAPAAMRAQTSMELYNLTEWSGRESLMGQL